VHGGEDRIRLCNLVSRAEERLGGDERVDRSTRTAVLGELAAALAELDQSAPTAGLAIFVSPGEHHVHRLTVPITERVVVDTTFATRDLVRAFQRRLRYRLLVLAEKPTRLFAGTEDSLAEIIGSGFPAEHQDVYSSDSAQPRPRAARTSFPGAIGGQGPALPSVSGRSALRDARLAQFLRDVDASLEARHQPDPLPLIVVGTRELLASYDEVTRHADVIAGRITGAHQHSSASELLTLVQPVMAGLRARRQTEALDAIGAAIARRSLASGLDEVWSLAVQGRGAHLVIERGYVQPARRDGDTLVAVTAEEAEAGGVGDAFVADAVDDIIEAVLLARGEVTFVDDGLLQDRDRIALVVRG
jgi:Bacterial archaeo-eukaryotic release factor family 3